MAVTPNYGWPVPVATDYVKDGWEAISDLGNAIDTTVAGLGSGALTFITGSTFTSQSSVTYDNCFTSTYENYFVQIAIAASARGELRMQFRDGTSDYTTNAYENANIQRINAGLTSYLGNLNFVPISYAETTLTSANLKIYSPALAVPTGVTYEGTGLTVGTANNYQTGGCGMLYNTTFEGMKFYPSTGTMTGSIRIYGYQNS